MARSLSVIASEIRSNWKPDVAAAPYLAAMSVLNSPTDVYGADTGKSMVLHFLANAGSWRGETARQIKAELKALAK